MIVWPIAEISSRPSPELRRDVRRRARHAAQPSRPGGSPAGEHRRPPRARRRHPLRTRPCPRSIPSSQNTEYAKQGGGRPLGPDRIALIDKQGIDIQVLSINGFWWYEVKDRDLADRIVRAQNEGLAKFVAQYPDRFVAMASSSLQFPDLAAQQLEDGVKRLGLRAAAIGGHVNGEDLSLPKFDPFWAKAAELGVVVFMHPGGAENIIRDGAFGGRGDLGQHHRQPARDDLLPVAADLRRRRSTSSRTCKVCGAHAGGYLPSYLGRTEVGVRGPQQRELRRTRRSRAST